MDTDRLPDGVNTPDDPWDFGTVSDYPRLKADRNGDGSATAREFPGQEPSEQSKIDYDTDNDNLIEITSLGQLNALRWDLDGDGVHAAPSARHYDDVYPKHLEGMGCPDGCVGYELTRNLDFDANQNWDYDEGDHFWNGGAGWEPIGRTTPYSGEFNGNGKYIAGLYINRTGNHVGLFGQIGGTGFVHHVALSHVNITTDGYDVGALVGFMKGSQTDVAASYASRGTVTGGAQTGGLVGSNQGWVVASWTNVTVQGTKHVGGIVGHNRGSVASAFAVGAVSGDSWVHGVVGATVGSTLQLQEVYYNSDNYPVNDPPYSRTTKELQAPTDYEGIYANWNVDTNRRPAGVNTPDDPWDFGTDSRYPRLRVTRSTYDDQQPPVRMRLRKNSGNTSLLHRGTTVFSGDPIKAQFFTNYREDTLATSGFSQTAGPEVIVSGKADNAWEFYAPDTASVTTLEFTLSATDYKGETNSVSWDLELHPVLPTAVATASDSVSEGDMVTLSGDASYGGFKYFYSADAASLPSEVRPVKSYQWTQTGGPDVALDCALTGPEIEAAGCEDGIATFTAPQVNAATSLSFELTVTDERDLMGSAGVSFPVSRSLQTGRSVTNVIFPPIACAGDDLTGASGETVRSLCKAPAAPTTAPEGNGIS